MTLSILVFLLVLFSFVCGKLWGYSEGYSASIRDVSGSENNRNRSRCTRNKSGIVGVCWDSRVSKWIAYIKAGPIKRRLGGFCCLLDAAAARKSAETQLGFSETHGARKTQLRT
jgi:hypothetical protein